MAAQRLLAWPKQASSGVRNLVLGVLKSHNEPLSTRELFEKAVKVPRPPGARGEPLTPSARYLRSVTPAPPHPDHPVRSLRYVYHAHPNSHIHNHASTRQLSKTNGTGGSCSHARRQEGAHKTRVDSCGSRTPHVDDVQGPT